MLWKCYTQYASKIGKLSSSHRTGKGQFHSNPKERQCQRMLKLPQNFTHASHMIAKRCPKFSKPGFNSTWTVNFLMYKMDSEKAEPFLLDHGKNKSSRKTSTSALLTTLKPLTVWITRNCGKFWKRWEYQTSWPASWETCMPFKKQQLELDLEKQTGSKLEKEYVRLYIVTLLI